MGRLGGSVVSEDAFFSVDLSSNPAGVYKNCFQRTKMKPGVAHKKSRWLDSNRGSLMYEATALPIFLPPCTVPVLSYILFAFGECQIRTT